MASIGLVAGSMKPVTAGHWSLITRAASENDEVLLFVSLADRKRKGELPVLGSTMEKIWRDHLIPALPSNVTVKLGGVPIRDIWETLGDANEGGASETYRIYSDPEDLAKRFDDDKLKKYVPQLYRRGLIDRRPISREGGINISGTQMRKYIQQGDEDSFKQFLPPVSDRSKDAIWQLLSGQVTESLLRHWIRGLI